MLDGLNVETQTHGATFWLLIGCKTIVLRMDDSWKLNLDYSRVHGYYFSWIWLVLGEEAAVERLQVPRETGEEGKTALFTCTYR